MADLGGVIHGAVHEQSDLEDDVDPNDRAENDPERQLRGAARQVRQVASGCEFGSLLRPIALPAASEKQGAVLSPVP